MRPREFIVRLGGAAAWPETVRAQSIHANRFYPAAGGLMSHGVNATEQYRAAATYVDRILGGTKTADLPVQSTAKFELVISPKTARALSLNVPATLLARADEVIE